jgi:hypothetical protein
MVTVDPQAASVMTARHLRVRSPRPPRPYTRGAVDAIEPTSPIPFSGLLLGTLIAGLWTLSSVDLD